MKKELKVKTVIPLDMERIYIDQPEFYGQEMIDRHIKRYEWALTYLKSENKVVDMCCGSGYGSKMIADNCKIVLGIDKNKDAIIYAQNNYEKSNLTFILIDPTKYNYHDIDLTQLLDIYNAVVWLEGIEHFTQEDAEKMLMLFKTTMPECRLIISTPDKDQSNNENKYHLKEYTAYELKSLISRYFKVIDIKIEDKFIYLVAIQNG